MILFSLLIASSACANKDKAMELFKRGMAAFNLNEYHEAIRIFSDGYKEEPEATFIDNIAQAHRLNNHPEKALDFYKK